VGPVSRKRRVCRVGRDEIARPPVTVRQDAHPSGGQMHLCAGTLPGRVLVHSRVVHLRGVRGTPDSRIGAQICGGPHNKPTSLHSGAKVPNPVDFDDTSADPTTKWRT